MHKRIQGELAESLASSWLQQRGYRFIERNFNRRVGEIDLVFEHPDGICIVFVEVRFRADQRFGGGIASVDWQKQRKLIRTANAWLQQHANSRVPARIDVIGVQPANEQTPPEQLWQAHEIIWIQSAVET